jgi:hypothetical protein
VIVPKRFRWMGWTLNFAHPGAAMLSLVVISTVLIVPQILAEELGAPPWFGVALALVELVALLGVCTYLASPHRYSDE